MNEAIIRQAEAIVGSDYLLRGRKQTAAYLYDEVETAFRPPANPDGVVLKPDNAEQVSQLLKLANDNRIPVVVRGGGTGLAGACTPIYEGFIISMERMNRIVEIDEDNMVAVLEAGVTLMQLLEELEKYPGLSFPVHPGDEGAQMGGMAVTNAGGARAVRHGVMRKHILGVEAVLPDGAVLDLGGKLIKNNAGYNLTQLLLGSEGTLAVITKVLLKLYHQDKATATIVAPFAKLDDACQAVLDVLKSGNIPLAIEYMDKRLFVGTARMLGFEWQAQDGEADLLFMLAEKSEEQLYAAVREIQEICERHNCLETLYAGKKREQDEILLVRSQHYDFIKDDICDGFDMAVPVSEIPHFIRALKDLVHSYGTETNVLAHIADGNVHHDMLLVDGKIPSYAGELKQRMYELCFSFGGTITGEHGVGKTRVQDLKLQKTQRELELMRGIKTVFDPNGIMNPGTIFDC